MDWDGNLWVGWGIEHRNTVLIIALSDINCKVLFLPSLWQLTLLSCLVTFSFLSSAPGNIFYTQWLASSSKPPPIFFGLQGSYNSNSCTGFYNLKQWKLVKSALNLAEMNLSWPTYWKLWKCCPRWYFIFLCFQMARHHFKSCLIFAQPRSLWVDAQENQESTGNRGSFSINHKLLWFMIALLVTIWFRQAYSAKQLDKLEAEFKVNS